jgi:hypothetical protein
MFSFLIFLGMNVACKNASAIYIYKIKLIEHSDTKCTVTRSFEKEIQ